MSTNVCWKAQDALVISFWYNVTFDTVSQEIVLMHQVFVENVLAFCEILIEKRKLLQRIHDDMNICNTFATCNSDQFECMIVTVSTYFTFR